MELQLKITGYHHNILKKHLLPSDGKESVAVALCGRYSDKDHEFLLVHDLILIADNECYSREYDLLHWPTKKIIPYFERIATHSLAIMKIHSHPGGYNQFSKTDDKSDFELFNSVFGWSMDDKPHASAVMLPGGKIFGRFFFSDLRHEPISKISIISDVLQIEKKDYLNAEDQFSIRSIQAFGEKTINLLKNLRIGVVGCSGTGSPLIEQLARLGVGEFVLIDPDLIEHKNLNRIINSTFHDAENKVPKVKMIKSALNKIGLGTKVDCFQKNLYESSEALNALIKCDVIFGCVDSVDGRHLLNQLCAFYLIPYFDLGVKLEADGQGGVNKICGSVHYIQPGKSSLITRGLYNLEDLRAAAQMRKNPEEYEELKKNSYIKNINVNSPAVISVNMQISSHAVNEFLNRLHPFKSEAPSNYALSTIDITEACIISVPEADFEIDEYLKNKVGRGNVYPFIEMADIAS